MLRQRQLSERLGPEEKQLQLQIKPRKSRVGAVVDVIGFRSW